MSSNETQTQDVAGALYVFAAWLTCRDEPVTMGANHDAARVAELVDEFCRANAIPEPAEDFHLHFQHPR